MEVITKSLYQTSDTSPVDVNPEQISETNNIRLRHIKSNIQTPRPAHFVLSTGDYQLHKKDDDDLYLVSRYKHNKKRICFLILTALLYLLHTLRSYIPEHIQPSSDFWSIIKPSPSTRLYNSDFRLNFSIERHLLHLTEICQTFWLVYILSFIVRRTHIGYLYRNPNIFTSWLCILLISAVSFRTISETSLPPEILCVCLWICFILLIITCRLMAIKFSIYKDKYKSFDLIITRYFVLNALFLYTITIGYLTICSSIECVAFHLDPNVQSITLATTIGLSIVFILLLIYSLLDQFVYANEFRSIWTPYLFLAIVFPCPPLRELFSNKIDEVNCYLFWGIFITTIFIILIRIGRQLFLKYRQRRIRSSMALSIDQKSLETGN